jgi:uncharacterized membrane protein (DUF4010 family)
MDPTALFERLAAALAIGLLVGIERGWAERDEREGERAAGLRTFALAGLLGGVWGALAAADDSAVALALAAMTVILLPILPDRAIDPWNALNPRDVWVMTVAIAVVSFGGYVAVKVAGERRGLLLSAVAGSLVSSTAVTLDMARLAHAHPERAAFFSGAVALAGATMIARVLVIAGIFNPDLLRWLFPALALAGLASLAGSGVVLLRARRGLDGGSELALTNPFEIATVLKFGALLAVVMLIAEGLIRLYGAGGAYALAAASGIADVDAITLSLTRLARTALDPETASKAILIAVAVNSLSKGALAWLTGGAAIGWRTVLVAATAIAAGFAGLGLADLWDPLADLWRE